MIGRHNMVQQTTLLETHVVYGNIYVKNQLKEMLIIMNNLIMNLIQYLAVVKTKH